MHPGQPDYAHLRVSDDDRNNVLKMLERAVGEGMLTLDEFTERTDRALAARTRGELGAVIGDLPMAPQAPPPLLLNGRMSSLSRRGQWTVPPRIQLDTRACDTTLDFTAATLHSRVVQIDIDDYASSTTLILPDPATADLEGVRTVASGLSVKVPTAPPSRRLHLVVRGRVRMGALTARYAYGAKWRRWVGR